MTRMIGISCRSARAGLGGPNLLVGTRNRPLSRLYATCSGPLAGYDPDSVRTRTRTPTPSRPLGSPEPAGGGGPGGPAAGSGCHGDPHAADSGSGLPVTRSDATMQARHARGLRLASGSHGPGEPTGKGSSDEIGNAASPLSPGHDASATRMALAFAVQPPGSESGRLVAARGSTSRPPRESGSESAFPWKPTHYPCAAGPRPWNPRWLLRNKAAPLMPAGPWPFTGGRLGRLTAHPVGHALQLLRALVQRRHRIRIRRTAKCSGSARLVRTLGDN